MTDITPSMHILIVDHKPDFYQTVAALANQNDYPIEYVDKLKNALDRIASEKFDIVLLREHLPDGDAIEVLGQITEILDAPAVIIIGLSYNPDSVEKLFNNGAWDYFLEYESPSTLFASFKNILYVQEKSKEQQKSRDTTCYNLKNNGIIGNSASTQRCLDAIAKAGPSHANVLISGESGTGKELFARAIHAISPRADKEMIVVDCASLPENLVESILFGHVRGAFTSADRAHDGLFRKSHGSTLFLDEIGELPLEVQKKFLRVLQERQLRPVGSNTTIEVDFRLIAATNKDLQDLVNKNLFREDLFFRLKTFEINLPSLRNKRSDIPELAYFFMNAYCADKRLTRKRFSPEYLVVLRRYHWPGNVRELFNVIERSIAAAMDTEILLPIHLPINVRVQALGNINKKQEDPEEIVNSVFPDDSDQPFPTLQEVRNLAMEKTEKKYLHHLLDYCGGNVVQACNTAGLSRSRFYALLKKYHLSP